MKKYKLGVEIGAGDRYSSELLNVAREFDNVWLIEPNPILYHDLSLLYSNKNKPNNVEVFSAAIADKSFGRNQIFYNFGYCSFLWNAPSFLKLSCEDGAINYWSSLIRHVSCVSIKEIDNGMIDYLILTCQGSEMLVLNDMISRPEIIRTKYYCHNAKHWAYYNQISKWMAENGYEGTVLDRSQHGTYFHLEFKKNG